ncbi:ferritin-like domain-containing protein [Thermosediminibacter oceani]|uniref:Rubrerythrin n=1 Tax=Thermosediminibacter oceani (strain ATCC BAA-1034 / DSM 16646 / JW/IW-1228P) TaxID=555079 RepID=D9S0E3_THEOJ|nr:ferritin family protein [Thermosediminibacter oceani]ADL08801.1 Rubrerythrin [Thermosediminibacter oceani DSM 16646]
MEKRKLTVENLIGETKGTELEGIVKQNFTGETKETGIYLAMARLAQRQGYAEIAEVLKTIAWEEAQHAARFAELNGMIHEDLFENIRQMLDGETAANEGKKQAADKAAALGLDTARDYFNESAKDEARHARMLEGILMRYAK